MGNCSNKNEKKPFLILSIVVNLLLLFSFKYFDFFSDSLNAVWGSGYAQGPIPTLDLILPVGISFYTFQTLSYSVDIYNNRITPERNFGKFALYVSFFPQLVAGPIERASRLLPQFNIHHKFEYARIRNGIILFIWGLLKKVVIADRLVEYVEVVFNSPLDFFGIQVWLGTMFYYVQLYCDFSGYTDMALGIALILGFNLMENFKQPFFSTSIKDFWNRWHISLSTWFRDYMYIPLGGNRKGIKITYFNILIVFMSTGFWHGAAWTYVLFGLSHALLIIGNFMIGPYVLRAKQYLGLLRYPILDRVLNTIYTLFAFSITLLIFRSHTIKDSYILFCNSLDFNSGSKIMNLFPYQADMNLAILFIAIVVTVDSVKEFGDHKKILTTLPKVFKWLLLTAAILSIIILGKFKAQDFIYFQF